VMSFDLLRSLFTALSSLRKASEARPSASSQPMRSSEFPCFFRPPFLAIAGTMSPAILRTSSAGTLLNRRELAEFPVRSFAGFLPILFFRPSLRIPPTSRCRDRDYFSSFFSSLIIRCFASRSTMPVLPVSMLTAFLCRLSMSQRLDAKGKRRF